MKKKEQKEEKEEKEKEKKRATMLREGMTWESSRVTVKLTFLRKCVRRLRERDAIAENSAVWSEDEEVDVLSSVFVIGCEEK